MGVYLGVSVYSELMFVFQADEYVVYSPHQQRMQYLVEFTLPGDSDQSDQPEELEGTSAAAAEEEDAEETQEQPAGDDGGHSN